MNRRSRSESYEDQTLTHQDLQPLTLIEQEFTTVWRFPIDISQSSIGGRTTPSNACTLIALKIAELIHIHNIDMPSPQMKSVNNERVMGGAEMTEKKEKIRVLQNSKVFNNHNYISESETTKCPTNVISCLINGIIDGNEAYIEDAGEGSTRNYNLPDAIKACQFSFAEVDFKLTTGSLKDTIPKLIRLGIKHPLFRTERRLSFVLISCVRTVLIVFDRTQHSLTLFDAHHHICIDKKKSVKHGALIGTCRYSNLNSFGQWIQNFVFPDIATNDEAFEISLIQMTMICASKAQGSCIYSGHLTTPSRTTIFHVKSSKEDKENQKLLDYPVLRGILSTPLKTMAKIGAKRRRDSASGRKNAFSGEAKKSRA